MESRIHFSKQPKLQKILYAAVIAVLIVTAIVVGVVSANNRKSSEPIIPEKKVEEPIDERPEDKPKEDEEKKAPVFVAPAVGTIMTEHSLTVPVFSDTLGEWRMHTGIDISTEENAPVFATLDGTVTKITTDPMMGATVEIDHGDGLVSIYQNLDATSLETLSVGQELFTGDKIGEVGDSAIAELASEAHLHFAMREDGAYVNPLDYFSNEVKRVSLGINTGVEA